MASINAAKTMIERITENPQLPSSAMRAWRRFKAAKTPTRLWRIPRQRKQLARDMRRL
jgi:hypothetical protein